MPWVRFTADFPFHTNPSASQTVMYLAGQELLVSGDVLKQATEAGKAIEIERPPKAPRQQYPEDEADAEPSA